MANEELWASNDKCREISAGPGENLSFDSSDGTYSVGWDYYVNIGPPMGLRL